MSLSKSVDAVVAESRRRRRQRRLEQLEIPENELTLTNELLGKGGFGAVYMAEFNGRSAAAKVVEIDHYLGGPAGPDGQGDVPEGKFCILEAVWSILKAKPNDVARKIRSGATPSCID